MNHQKGPLKDSFILRYCGYITLSHSKDKFNGVTQPVFWKQALGGSVQGKVLERAVYLLYMDGPSEGCTEGQL